MTQPIVVVLGAHGFIGRHVARAFSQLGCTVLGLGHGSWSIEEWRRWGIYRWVESDINASSLDKLVADDQPRCIVNCGGSGAVSLSYANPLEDFQRATQTTAILLDWIRTRCLKECRFVLVSSAAVYGDQGYTDLTEASVRLPISPYGVHKMAAELLCESFSRFFEVPSTIVRLFSVYGEGLRKQLLWDAAQKFKTGKGEFFGTGNEIRDWIHVTDAAKLLTLAGLSGQPTFEIYNGGYKHANTREILTLLSKNLDFKGVISFNEKTHNGNPYRLTSSSRHAFEKLGWTPQISLEDGLDTYAAWFKATH